MPPIRQSHTRHRAAQVAAAAILASLVAFISISAGGFSLFNSATAPPSAMMLDAGTVSISLGASGSPTGDYLTTAISQLAPGDLTEQGVTVTNTGSLPVASVVMDVITSSPGPLASDATNGLAVSVLQCSTPWTATPTSGPSAGAEAYGCSGTQTTDLPGTPLATITNTAVTLTGPLAAGASDNFVVVFGLPAASSGAIEQGQSVTVGYVFSGAQEPGGPE